MPYPSRMLQFSLFSILSSTDDAPPCHDGAPARGSSLKTLQRTGSTTNLRHVPPPTFGLVGSPPCRESQQTSGCHDPAGRERVARSCVVQRGKVGKARVFLRACPAERHPTCIFAKAGFYVQNNSLE